MVRVVLIAALAAGGLVFLHSVELDERLLWAGLLPLTYVVGLIALSD